MFPSSTVGSPFFSSTDGCISTSVSLAANDQVIQRPPSPKSPLSFASLVISRDDLCAGTQPFFAFGGAELAEAEFQVARSLDSATLNTTIGVFEFESGSSFNVDVAMTWTGSGNVTREPNHLHFGSPGVHIQWPLHRRFPRRRRFGHHD